MLPMLVLSSSANPGNENTIIPNSFHYIISGYTSLKYTKFYIMNQTSEAMYYKLTIKYLIHNDGKVCSKYNSRMKKKTDMKGWEYPK